jgi:hypothetical protein
LFNKLNVRLSQFPCQSFPCSVSVQKRSRFNRFLQRSGSWRGQQIFDQIGGRVGVCNCLPRLSLCFALAANQIVVSHPSNSKQKGYCFRICENFITARVLAFLCTKLLQTFGIRSCTVEVVFTTTLALLRRMVPTVFTI